LGLEGALIGRPRLAAGDIGGQAWVFAQNARNLSRTDTISKSPALNAPSSQSALPKRAESWLSRSRMRSFTRGKRSAAQSWSPKLGVLHDFVMLEPESFDPA
jgi:hypothetical protein